MRNILSYFEQAELALAAYADLAKGSPLLDALIGAGMTRVQATHFRSRWSVVDQRNFLNGLSVTVFESVFTGERFLAVRGSDDGLDLITDAIDISLIGSTLRQQQYQVLRSQVAQWLEDGTLSPTFSVSGHSLGGFLAAGILADFDAHVAQAYLYNAPGVNGVFSMVAAANAIFSALGLLNSPDSARIANIKADAGMSGIAMAGTQLAPPQWFAIEDQTRVSDPMRARNHSQAALVDALAIYNAFSTLAADASVDTITSIIKGASERAENTLEKSLDGLRLLVLGESAVAANPTTYSRDALYTNLEDLHAAPEYVNLIGHVALRASTRADDSAIRTRARESFAHFLALQHLLPFVLEGSDAHVASVNPGLFEAWESDRLRGTGETSYQVFSDVWLADRAAMLGWTIKNNVADGNVALRSNRVVTYEFTDTKSNSVVTVAGTQSQSASPLKIVFGSDTSEALVGGDVWLGDRLYGAGGNDTIVGKGGADYLEGGAGIDVLDGGDGNDTLMGGADDDTYRGGTGVDRYIVGQGLDSITDDDGRGLVLDGFENPIAGLFLKEGSGSYAWVSDPTVTASMIGSMLRIQLPNASTVYINNFTDGKLDLSLSETKTQLASSGTLKVGKDDAHVIGSYGDYLLADGGGSTLDGKRGVDYLAGAAGNDKLFGGDQPDYISGALGNNWADGGAGGDVIVLGGGEDYANGGADGDFIGYFGADAYPAGLDTLGRSLLNPLYIWAAQPGVNAAGETGLQDFRVWVMTGPARTDYGTPIENFIKKAIYTTPRNQEIRGGGGRDFIYAGPGDDLIYGDAGNASTAASVGSADYFWWTTHDFSGWGTVQAEPAVPDVGPGTDYIVAGKGNDAAFGEGGTDMLAGGEGADYLDGGADDDYVVGEAGDDMLVGGDGSDRLYGDGGIAVANHGADYLDGGAGRDYLSGDAGSDSIFGGDDDDVLFGDNLESPASAHGDDYLDGEEGNDLAFGLGGNDDIFGGAGQDELQGNDGDDYLDGEADADKLLGDAGNDEIYGGDGDDQLYGGDGADYLDGEDGFDQLSGEAGADTMAGGAGDDTYYVDDIGDVVIEGTDAGFDTVFGTISFTLPDNVEQYSSLGAAAVSVIGNASDNELWGNAADNRIDGGAGVDVMVGRAGNDTYIVDDDRDQIAEGFNEGVDSVVSSVYYQLPYDVENLTLSGDSAEGGVGNAQDNVLIGNTVDNTFFAYAGNDTLDGRGGADRMYGDAGNDTYIVDDAGDMAIESVNGGTDTVKASISYLLGYELENLTLTGVAAITATGNELNNSITGNAANNVLSGAAGNDVLSGGGGADSMTGGAGNDLYIVDNVADVITEIANDGTDSVQSCITHTLSANLENLTLTGTSAINGTGNALNNNLTGNVGNNILSGAAGNDTLTGGAGADTLVGGAGDDLYAADALDIITENAAEGTDSVQTSASHTLSVNVENLTLLGTATILGTGNALNNNILGNIASNVLSGAAGNDTLNGGAGADTLFGGVGDDTYVLDSPSDLVTENIAEGTDTVQAAVTYTLGANVENLTLTGAAAINGTGNSSNNLLRGNAANNILNGAAGADTMTGAAGNDTYVVDNPADVVTEAANEGTDVVQSSVTFILAANIESLTLTGTAAINGTGNGADNVLAGNAGNNSLTGAVGNDTLNGGAGADTLAGGPGNDVYVIDSTADVLTEFANEGIDTVQSSVTYTLGSDLENLSLTGNGVVNGTGNALNNALTGNSASNVLTGGAGNDALDGGAGADTLIGGGGDDTYVADDVLDIVSEAANEGIDTVRSFFTQTLSANLENLTLLGTATINGNGHAGANVLIGNSASNILTGYAGNDTLDGGAGTDTMLGGTGDDIYVVDAADIVTENAGEGSDTVRAYLSYSLGVNLENLALLGTAAINGTGNAIDNSIWGNTGNNVLNGGGGTDTLRGGAGNDTYVVDGSMSSWRILARGLTPFRQRPVTRSGTTSRTSR